METIKNIITYTHNRYPKLRNFSLKGNYKNKHGKIIQLVDVNGLEIDYTINSASFVLNKTIENDRLVDEWLQEHPTIQADWTRVDLVQKEQIDTKKTLDSAQAIIEAAKMNIKDVMDFAKLHKMNMNSNTDVLRAHIIKVAQDSPDKFMETHFDPEKDYRVFILDALNSKNLSYKNSTFMYGKQAIGTNEEQVIVWLKDNKDIFALIKHDLRGETPKAKSKTKEKV